MAYTVKFTTKKSTEGPTFKLQRDKRFLLHNDIERLANQPHNKHVLVANFGSQLLDAYIKLKDNKGWALICELKLI